ncbi:MAG TPA: cupin domain-containing protein [Ramlibacter sp.]|nr:cupin domain-containing protein [Ramlibacter sp.]
MKNASAVRRCTAGLALAIAAPLALAQAGQHVMMDPAKLSWTAVPSLPPGAQLAVIEGPMSEAVPFTVRLKFPANYRIPPHWHPAVERVTVLSGTINMGAGEKFDTAGGHALATGAVTIIPAKSPHYLWTTGEAIVQLHGTGPWGITYLNKADDPRSK